MILWTTSKKLLTFKVEILRKVEANLLAVLLHLIQRLSIEICIKVNFQHVVLASVVKRVLLAPHANDGKVREGE